MIRFQSRCLASRRRLRAELLEQRVLLAADTTAVPFSPVSIPADLPPRISPLIEASPEESQSLFPQLDDPDDGVASRAPLTNADTFLLHSKPGSDFTIFLDFDGGITEGTNWNNSTGIETLIDIAYTRDSNSGAFSNSELSQMREIWKLVAEDFAPFDVNVTTEDPGVEALRRNGGGDSAWGGRSLHTSNTNGVCSSCGGVAYINSFSSSVDIPIYTFNKGVSAGGNTHSHEAGHALNLSHDGLTNGTTYYAGHGSGDTSWGPIMGGPGSRDLKTWSIGDYYNANQMQDDLDRISSLNGFTYREDDHGDSIGTATPLEIDSTTDLSAFGIIEQNTDVDMFSFETSGGDVSFNIHPFVTHPNLDVWAGIYDSSGTLLHESNPSDNVSASFTNVTLAAGEFFLRVEGVGTHGSYNPALDAVFDPGEPDYTGPENGIPWDESGPTGYSDYASLGQYWITGTRAAAGTDTVSITPINAVQSEGDSGSTSFTFEVSRVGDNASALQLAYTVETATPESDNNVHPHTVSDNDFVAGVLPSGTVTIAAGQNSETLTIDIDGDTDFERDEHFRVVLSQPPTGWTISNSTAPATILTDETSVGVASINTAASTLEEGDTAASGSVFTYTLFRRGDDSGTTTADWQVDYTGFDRPASDADFVGGVRPQGQVTFNPGETEIDIDISVLGEFDVEGDESFRVEVTGVSGSNSVAVDSALPSQRGIILEDESLVTLLGDVHFRWRQIKHSNNNFDQWAIDNVTLSGSTFGDNFDPDIDSAQWDSIENGSVDDSVFEVPSGNALLMTGSGSRIATTVATVPAAGSVLSFDLIIGDNSNGGDNAENGEDVWLEYSVDGGESWAVMQMMDTDDYNSWTTVDVTVPATAIVSSSQVAEGNSGDTEMNFELIRSGYLDKTVIANWQVVQTGTDPADASDFSGGALPSGSTTFVPGDEVETISVLISGDSVPELDETYELVVTSTSGFVTNGTRTATVINDDALQVEAVVVNDGAVQRSSLTEVRVEFNALVDAPTAAFTLTNTGTPSNPANDAVTDLTYVFADVGSKTMLTITPNGGGSLANGNYRIDIDGSQVSLRGGGLSMDGTFTFGDEPTDNFFRKYGDDNGNNLVDLLDFASFRQTFGKSSADAGYNPGLDSDEDATIGLLDFAAFRQNFGT